jgi:hypothetical protein
MIRWPARANGLIVRIGLLVEKLDIESGPPARIGSLDLKYIGSPSWGTSLGRHGVREGLLP